MEGIKTKSMTGHLLGGAAAIEAILSVKALNERVIPPIINTEAVDPKIKNTLRIVTREAIERPLICVMSNAFGFGGNNSTVLFKAIS